MSLIADGILILTCLTTAIYCFVLSRRLQKLSNTDEGIGQQIKQLSSALKETRKAQRDLQDGAKAASDQLLREIAGAKQSAKALTGSNEAAQALIAKLEQLQADALRGYSAVEPAAESNSEPAPKKKVTPTPVPDEPEDADEDEWPNEPDLDGEPAQAASEETAEDPDEDESQMDLRDLIDDDAGEQQLGFLPDIDVREQGEDEDRSDAEQSEEAIDATGEDDFVDQSQDEHADDGALPTAPPASGDSNLLKVERVAL